MIAVEKTKLCPASNQNAFAAVPDETEAGAFQAEPCLAEAQGVVGACLAGAETADSLALEADNTAVVRRTALEEAHRNLARVRNGSHKQHRAWWKVRHRRGRRLIWRRRALRRRRCLTFNFLRWR